MPAEWFVHHSCIVIYPSNRETFRDSSCNKYCGPVRKEILYFCRSIRDEGIENVLIVCNIERDEMELKTLLVYEKNLVSVITIVACVTEDCWARDIGPTFAFRSKAKGNNDLIGLNWVFNSYGGPTDGCYWPCEYDRSFTSSLTPIMSITYNYPVDYVNIDLILEGGSFHTDGDGTVIVTEECLFNRNRNPLKNKEQIEKIFFRHLGCEKTIWLPLGLANDNDTNGHVDNIVTFTKICEVLICWTDDKENDIFNYRRVRRIESILKKEKDAKGRLINLKKLLLPPPTFYRENEILTYNRVSNRKLGQRLASSYINFYLANQAIILPQFGCGLTDKQAKKVLSAIFPEKKIVGVHSREILLGGGNIHCITQQIPNWK